MASQGRSANPSFYSGLSFGSESEFNPLSEMVNEGFDTFQMKSTDRHVFRAPYDVGWRTVERSVLHPAYVIKTYGPARLVRTELLPLTARGPNGGAWTGNYALHLLGSGMVSARLREWYAQHDVPASELAADGTMALTHVLNEVIEASKSDGYREETLPDLLLFDPVGMLAFHFSAVEHLFHNDRVTFTNWPRQPSLLYPDTTLENVGQFFVLKARLPGSTNWSFFANMGLSAQAGLSRLLPNGAALSFAGGASAVGFRITDPTTQKTEVASWGLMGSIYYDRANSLESSLVYDTGADNDLVLNVYPGVLRVGKLSPGLWVQRRRSRGNGIQLGLVGSWGFGLAVGPHH